MYYSLAQRIVSYWLSIKWRLWTRHSAWEMVRHKDPDLDDPRELAGLCAEAGVRGDILLAAQLEAMLNDMGCDFSYIGMDDEE